jgi:hypothetical protein
MGVGTKSLLVFVTREGGGLDFKIPAFAGMTIRWEMQA